MWPAREGVTNKQDGINHVKHAATPTDLLALTKSWAVLGRVVLHCITHCCDCGTAA
jgi:hypothetical protein